MLVATLVGATQPSLRAIDQPDAKPDTSTFQLPQAKQDSDITVAVIDEARRPVSSARVMLERHETHYVLQVESNSDGECAVKNLSPGAYNIRAEKDGYYPVLLSNVQLERAGRLEVTLNHRGNLAQQIDVTEKAPAIDPAKTTASESLNSHEIKQLPYWPARDIRYALPLLPGVLQDASGQAHVEGSAAHQTIDQLDGFKINNPVDGLFAMRVNTDAVQSLRVQTSRYGVEYGNGSGGVVSLLTNTGDDHFRISGTDFTPSLRSHKGIYLNGWTPRATFSGPIRKGKAWFLLAPEGEYHVNVVNELPRGADRSKDWRFDNLAKAQIQLKPSNILTASYLANHYQARYAGLSRFNPLETTHNLSQVGSMLTIKDQAFLTNGILLEVGLGESRFYSGVRPLGNQTYVVSPEGRSGNYFESARGWSSRLQGIANVITPAAQWHGRHEFRFGGNVERLTDEQFFQRHSYLVLREHKTLSRTVEFLGTPSFARSESAMGGYAQDRWSPTDRWLIESGVRFDWDGLVREARVSPRLASSYMLTRSGDTKLVTGIGLYYETMDLDSITRPLTGQRVDAFYIGPNQDFAQSLIVTSFHVNERNLKDPRFLNWSAGIERKLPGGIYSDVEFTEKRGHNGLTFINRCAGPLNCFSGYFVSSSERRDHYDSVKVTLRSSFKGGHVILASYAHSVASSNAVLDFSLENPLFSQQAGGRLPWDSPNRFITWGLVPLKHGFDLAYSLDWRDGYPFNLVNQDQQLVGAPSSRRFPRYFCLNAALERRVQILGYQWDLRVGLDDLTNRTNPTAVNNVIDSTQFLTFGGFQRRALVGQVKLLGRK